VSTTRKKEKKRIPALGGGEAVVKYYTLMSTFMIAVVGYLPLSETV
jgi:hypothetical protein